ncbi:isopenicillin N synthase family oxygenase [Iodobacter sp. HSC-16F04]|uniref:2-oxoglutarate-dependent ethylene/succinate-forming enzyme n=1 Tax=Iodobacter violaceini TaxID=3044271 RepID=A0ABX0KUB9_9NEIS|nr:isopenicillin N synthase family oxygenase [Iodobacter violacea]
MCVSLPILDLALFDSADREAFLRDLRLAARDYGFFYLRGHGLSLQYQQDMLLLAEQFFALSGAEKTAVAMVNSPHFRGYTRLGGELTAGRADQREQFDIMNEGLAALDPQPAWRRLRGPNQWPASLPALKPGLLLWQDALSDICERLMQAFALALGQPADIFAPLYRGEPFQHLKMIRYPGSKQAEQGVGAHKDAGLLTLVMQDTQSGLQVATAGGWLDAPPVPGTFVVNIGELLELSSNGYLRATVHRVVSPPAGVERLSYAFFMGPRLDATVPQLQLPAALAQEVQGEASDPANPLFSHVGENVLKGRMRSHPDVAARHYSDTSFASQPVAPVY